jgi:hypothetical protein
MQKNSGLSIFVLEPREPAKVAIGKRVTVVDYPDGRLALRYNGAAYRTFDKVCQVATMQNCCRLCEKWD